MLYNMPERRIEPFERFTRSVVCPVCGKADPVELYFQSESKHIFLRSDIIGCDRCVSQMWDEDEIREILSDD